MEMQMIIQGFVAAVAVLAGLIGLTAVVGFGLAVVLVGVVGMVVVVTATVVAGRSAIGWWRRSTRKKAARRRTMPNKLTWSQVEARIERARQVLGAGQYTIRSVDVPTAKAAGATATYAVRNGDSANGDPYIVAFYERTPTGVCSCPDFQRNRGPACKHTAMVVLAEWPNSLSRWKAKVRTLCALEPEPAPQPEPQDTPLTADVETMIRQVVHERLSAMEAQITATIVQAFQGNLTPARE